MEKKKWERPELMVLVRGRAEEAVLQICKTLGVAGADRDTCTRIIAGTYITCSHHGS